MKLETLHSILKFRRDIFMTNSTVAFRYQLLWLLPSYWILLLRIFSMYNTEPLNSAHPSFSFHFQLIIITFYILEEFYSLENIFICISSFDFHFHLSPFFRTIKCHRTKKIRIGCFQNISDAFFIWPHLSVKNPLQDSHHL